MREKQVVEAFCAHLQAQDWDVRTEVKSPSGPIDVVATIDGHTLLAEAKGHTAAIGLDINTLYGQLLNRMSDETASYAVVVPESARSAALRVPRRVRDLLNITVYVVTEAEVRQVEVD